MSTEVAGGDWPDACNAQGDIPLGGQWSIDWLGGVAVLFGERSVQSNATAVTNILVGKGAGTTIVTVAAANASDSPAILNVDAQAGLSYSFTPNTKFTVSDRFDEYFRALKTLTSVTNGAGTTISSSNLDRSFSGPMVRLTTRF